MSKELERSEELKYDKVWSSPDYGKTSPSESLGVHILLESGYFRIPETSTDFRKTITDYGSGCGRTSHRLHTLGYSVKMVDISDNSISEEVKEVVNKFKTHKFPRPMEFYKSPLWDIKEVPRSNYGICCDVMEHIPTSKVDDVLNQLALKTKGRILFQISCIPDTFSERAGTDTLHLTIKPPSWWKETISKHFKVIEGYHMFKKLYVCICEAK